jgi:hypothetical protein
MKVKDILYALPKFSYSTLYNVNFIKVEKDKSNTFWQDIQTFNFETGKQNFSIELLNAEVELIIAGRYLSGGSYDDRLQLYINME